MVYYCFSREYIKVNCFCSHNIRSGFSSLRCWLNIGFTFARYHVLMNYSSSKCLCPMSYINTRSQASHLPSRVILHLLGLGSSAAYLMPLLFQYLAYIDMSSTESQTIGLVIITSGRLTQDNQPRSMVGSTRFSIGVYSSHILDFGFSQLVNSLGSFCVKIVRAIR